MHAIIMVRGKKMVCGWFFRLIDPVCGTRSEVTTLYVSRVPNVLSDDAAPRVRPRFFDQVGHETMYASSGNKHFFH